MSKKVISFLGATKMNDTTYRFGEHECETCYMAHASVEFFHPDELLVMVTDEARTMHLDALKQRIGNRVPLRAVAIPSGKSEDELWQIFGIIADEIQAEDRIFFDITNAFRSLPMLTLLIIAFVRLVKCAHVEHVVYGAYDPKREGATPVFDLTPFITLLDWTTATSTFLKYGRTADLHELLTTSELPQNEALMISLAKRLDALSVALYTSRSATIMQEADGLRTDIAAVEQAGGSKIVPLRCCWIRLMKSTASLGWMHHWNARRANRCWNGCWISLIGMLKRIWLIRRLPMHENGWSRWSYIIKGMTFLPIINSVMLRQRR
ncbi:MAG: TIGR02221 family CRISPR-associated protein [Chloroflexaceae bacterium]|nr:TIGR02221 family CRISPR-associated protein [Chloroflexaceae bacterium]